jgi:hypothetical protein
LSVRDFVNDVWILLSYRSHFSPGQKLPLGSAGGLVSPQVVLLVTAVSFLEEMRLSRPIKTILAYLTGCCILPVCTGGISTKSLLLSERETSLSWWLEEDQGRTYPNLSRFAIDILSLVEPERVFSGCRRTITWQRMRLGVKVVEEGECLKSWIRSSVVAGVRSNTLNSKVLRT